jgi:hypothetical protein
MKKRKEMCKTKQTKAASQDYFTENLYELAELAYFIKRGKAKREFSTRNWGRGLAGG